MVRHALVALGSCRLDMRPYERDGELVRVEIFGIEESSATRASGRPTPPGAVNQNGPTQSLILT